MLVYTLWHAGDDGEAPWIIDAVDEYTISNNCEFPPPYLKHRTDIDVLAAAKFRTLGDEQHAKDMECAAEQAEKGLASEWIP
jgi:hypothetical protein